ncbi:MAG: prepilin-type N-terminal cleavage/methylation domain-containing protein [Phycisphaerae bacterium]|nr:prepilin-type N-terminal cleavage/methylation domain-containing protein [Phycisphaerae bacterium]
MRSAFTLVEILIVVVILGILSAVVVPQFSNATQQATSTATYDQLVKTRQALGVYFVRNGSRFPQIVAGQGLAAWGQLATVGGDYLREPPMNLWVDPAVADVVVIGNTPDAGYQNTHGWIFDPATGNLWAGSFDINDKPFPKP